MEFKSPKCLQSPLSYAPNKREPPPSQHQPQQQLQGDPAFYRRSRIENPFVELVDPLCKLNLRETSEFVRAFPAAAMASRSCNESRGVGLFDASAQRKRMEGQPQQKRMVDSPSTPGRPIGFSHGNAAAAVGGRRSLPSKWEDAEKWLVSTSCHESPAVSTKQAKEPSRLSTQTEILCHRGSDGFADRRFLRVSEDKTQGTVVLSFHGSSLDRTEDRHGLPSSDVFLKDKFTDGVVEPIFPNFQYAEPSKESFLFSNSVCETMTKQKNSPPSELLSTTDLYHHRDVGTETTPAGSLTTSRCHTPIKTSSSPERHNTPADRSGLLAPPSKANVDVLELKDYHFEKLEFCGGQYDSIVSNWSSREEEEEEVSKSLRHFDDDDDGCGGGGGGRKSVAEARACAWEDEERTKSCIRYQREEARIKAWVNLQSAKAESQSRKLEVKIEKMRSNLEEKLMKRMAVVHKKAEEWRAAAQLHHSQQVQRASEQAQKMKSQQLLLLQQQGSYLYDRRPTRCGCFPCNNRI